MDRKFCPFLLLNSCTNSGLSQDNKNNRNRTHALHVNVARLNATLSHDASINKISLIADKSEGSFVQETVQNPKLNNNEQARIKIPDPKNGPNEYTVL